MGSSYLANPLVFLVQTIFGLYAAAVLLRFLLQVIHADFYNPVSQFIVKITSPLLNPLRRIVPASGKLDLASLVLAWLVKAAEVFLVLLISVGSFNPLGALLWAIPELVDLTLSIFTWAIIIQVILSWVAPGNYNPAASLIGQLVEPLMAPARRLIPPIGGLDLSPMVVIIGLMLVRMLLMPPLRMLTASPF
ncbi:MAG TPA: YggT family protein [Chromatiaceae bacterium]|nr:YggT family protein [Chromatiaceae bacterium]